jgi:hypothetical protein
LNEETKKRIEEIELAFHRRAFGEEMARVNFLPLAERKAYLARTRKRARSKQGMLYKDDKTSPLTTGT